MHGRFKLRIVYFCKMFFFIFQVVVENLLKITYMQAAAYEQIGIYRASGSREQRQEAATAIARIIGYRQHTTIHMYRERMMSDMNKAAATAIAKATGGSN